MEDINEIFDKFRKQKEAETTGFIQWKGTNVCVDIYCKCGEHHHFDGYFMYVIKCSECGTIYAANPFIKFLEVTEDEVKCLPKINVLINEGDGE